MRSHKAKDYELTPEQMKIVEEAREQYRRGAYLTDEEAEKELDELFEEFDKNAPGHKA